MNSDLLQSIADKLQLANRTSVIQKKREKEEAEQQYICIETSLQERRQRQAYEIDQAREALEHLSELSDQTFKGMAIKTNKEAEMARMIKEEMENKIEAEEKDHQQNIEAILERAEEKIISWTEEVEKKAKVQKQKSEALLNELAKKLVSLQKDFKDETQLRKQNCVKLGETIDEQICQFRQVIESEKERRKNAQHKIYAMLHEIQQKVSQSVEEQIAKRKRNNEAILSLIEAACCKLENGLEL